MDQFPASNFSYRQSPLEGDYEIRRCAYSEVSSLLPTLPYHTFELDQGLSNTCGLGKLEYMYILSNPSEIDASLVEVVLSPLLENLKEIALAQTQPLVSINPRKQQQVYRTIRYGVENLFGDESHDNPPGSIGDNIAGDYVYHRATPVPAGYRRGLLNEEWCQRSHHFFAVTLHNASCELILKLCMDDIKDLKMMSVDLLNTTAGKAERYKTLEECFSRNYQVKQAFTSQLLPMMDTIVKSVEEPDTSSNEDTYPEEQQNNPEELFGKASPVPPTHYPTLQASPVLPSPYSTLQAGSNRKRAYMCWLFDDPMNGSNPTLDPVLEPGCFKRAREYVGKQSAAADKSVRCRDETVDEGNPTAQTQDLIVKPAREPSSCDQGESGFSSAQISSSFNQAKCVMQVEKQLSVEIEFQQLKTEDISDEDEDENED